MSDFEKLVDEAQEAQYKTFETPKRSARDKMRALREEFGYQKTEPKQLTKEEENE